MFVLKATRRDVEAHEFHGLKEIAHNVLTCSACGEELLDVMVVSDKVTMGFQYRADCPHCGDHSRPRYVAGQVFVGPAGRTIYVDADCTGDIVYLRTQANPETP